MMKLMALTVSLLCAGQLVHALEGRPGTYSTPLVSENTMKCEAADMRQVKTVRGEILATLCTKEYRDCLFYGACVLEKSEGSRVGINFHKQDELKENSFFTLIDLNNCSYGYGFGRLSKDRAATTCLLPYVTVAADATVYNVGDVLFVPKLVGVTLPGGKVHDGYVIVGDSASLMLGAGAEELNFFTGHDSHKSKNNAFVKVGFGDPDKIFTFQVVKGSKAREVLTKNGFKVVRSYKHKFVAPENPMLGK
jgi:hypothetical protein